MPDPMPSDPRRIETAELLAIGAELLVGETRDTNSGDLARELTALGVAVRRSSQLPDDRAIVVEALQAALRRADLVITTGGLGPTPDDLTRESIAEALGQDVSVDPQLEAWLRDIFERRGFRYSETNRKQAWLIPSAAALPNPHGTAPGWWVEAEDGVIVALPGPPRELRPMWHDHVLPRLEALGLGADRAAETLRLTGIGESLLVDLVGADLLTGTNPAMATYARPDAVDLRVSAVGDGSRTATEIVAAAVASLSPRIDPYVFARGEDGWPEVLGRLLGGRSVAAAEVGTAGALGSLLGREPWFVLDRQTWPGMQPHELADLAVTVRSEAATTVGLALWAEDRDDGDMDVEVAVDLDGATSTARHLAFRGGDLGRQRAATLACAELWGRLRA